ncbi:MAG TPA: DUF5666 domain-containing protein [Verrucomicrobiae bacterium]|jgi:Domain of unknown function (DUF5666)|nr:DUF5666 domain-containing protein [Verrucomicrobiae bacterium]
MRLRQPSILTVIVSLAVLTEGCLFISSPVAQAQDAGTQTVAKSIGKIQSISGNTLTIAPESGPQVTANIQPTARILRLEPGEKDLKNAAPIPMQDLQVGDTVRVRGYASQDGKSIATLEVIVITHAAVAAVSNQIREDWQKRGLAGVVSSVDPSSGTVTISIPGIGEKKTVNIHTTSATIIRRYAPDSANFEAAKPSTLQEIHVNDQLRARGDRSPDGNDFNAVEIVTGTFPYVEGTIKSVDASANTISVQDVLSKKTVQLRVTSDSQLHQVPAEMAQQMAFRLKQAKSQGTGSSASTPAAANAQANQGMHRPAGGSQNGAAAAGMRAGGGGGLQKLLDSTPTTTLANLHKGDALAILATEGTSSTAGTIIKLYSGVEPILEAAPNAMTLAPWSLGGGAPGGDAGSP